MNKEREDWKKKKRRTELGADKSNNMLHHAQ